MLALKGGKGNCKKTGRATASSTAAKGEHLDITMESPRVNELQESKGGEEERLKRGRPRENIDPKLC